MTELNTPKVVGLEEAMYSPSRQVKIIPSNSTLHLRVMVFITSDALFMVADKEVHLGGVHALTIKALLPLKLL
jgi:hypothetical protein